MSYHVALRQHGRHIEQLVDEVVMEITGETPLPWAFTPESPEYLDLLLDIDQFSANHYMQPIVIPPYHATSLSNSGQHSVGFLGSDYHAQSPITPPLVNRETVHVFPSAGASFVHQEDGGSTARSQHALITEPAYSDATFTSQRTQRLQSAPESVSTTAPPSVSVSPQRMRGRRGAGRARRTPAEPRRESGKCQWQRDYPGCVPEGRVLLVLCGKTTAINAEHVSLRKIRAIADMALKTIAFDYGEVHPTKRADLSNNITKKTGSILDDENGKYPRRVGDDWSTNPPRLLLSEDDITSLNGYDQICKYAEQFTIQQFKDAYDRNH